MLHLVNFEHEFVIVIFALAQSKVQRLIKKLSDEGLPRTGVSPHVHHLNVLQVFVHLDDLLTRFRMRVHLSLAHRRVHLCVVVVKLSCAFLLKLLSILSKISLLRVLVLELSDARLLLDEVLLPFVEHVDNGHLLGVHSDLLLIQERLVDLKHAILWLDRLEVDICKVAI